MLGGLSKHTEFSRADSPSWRPIFEAAAMAAAAHLEPAEMQTHIWLSIFISCFYFQIIRKLLAQCGEAFFFHTVFLSWPLRSMFHLALITCESARLPPWLPPSHAERGTETCQPCCHYCFFFFLFLFLLCNTFTRRQKGSRKGRNFKCRSVCH